MKEEEGVELKVVLLLEVLLLLLFEDLIVVLLLFEEEEMDEFEEDGGVGVAAMVGCFKMGVVVASSSLLITVEVMILSPS